MVLLWAGPVAAQSVAERVRAVGDGKVRMSFAAKPGVCGDGQNIRTMRHTDDWEGWCENGPVRVALRVRAGEIVDIDSYVGGRWRPVSGVIDLGMVPAAEAASYLVSLAATLSGNAGKRAIVPAVLADSATVWPELLVIAKDQSRPGKTRRSAVFWLGQAATDQAVAGLEEIVDDDDADLRLREHAVFALSQRPNDEAVPALIRIARSHTSPRIRKKALFWLGQSEDPRAIALFEEILLKS
jgi:hypothetical protein